MPSPDILAFLAGRRAFLTKPSEKPGISAFFPLVSRFIRESKFKMPGIPASFSWFQHLFDKNTNKDLTFQALCKTGTLHMSKSDSYIKVSENNNDKY
jgi:hypothetical protein